MTAWLAESVQSATGLRLVSAPGHFGFWPRLSVVLEQVQLQSKDRQVPIAARLIAIELPPSANTVVVPLARKLKSQKTLAMNVAAMLVAFIALGAVLITFTIPIFAAGAILDAQAQHFAETKRLAYLRLPPPPGPDA